MYLKHKTPFNEKPLRSQKKKPVVESTRPECLKFTFDNQGNLKDVMTKTHGWVSISTVNKWHLLKVQALLIEKDAGDTPAYKGIYAEIQRRIAIGEITPADKTAKAVAKEENYG